MKNIKAVALILISSLTLLSCKKKEETPVDNTQNTSTTTTSGNPVSTGTWTIKSTTITSTLTKITFYNNKFGIIIGNNNTLLKTADSGANWQSISTLTLNTPATGCFMIDSLNILVSDYGSIRKTIDGGASWTFINTFSLNASAYGDFYFIDALNGFIATGSGVAKTTDGGNNWSMILGSPQNISRVRFTTPLIGWVSGTNGGVYRTIDGGVTWTNTNVGLTYITCSFFLNNTTAWAAESFNGSEIIKRTIDGGMTWTTVFPSTLLSDGITAFWFFNSNNGTQSRFLYTIKNTDDGGSNWNLKTSPLTNQTIKSFYFHSSNSGWAVGSSGLIMNFNQ